jgi:hypothetical protein
MSSVASVLINIFLDVGFHKTSNSLLSPRANAGDERFVQTISETILKTLNGRCRILLLSATKADTIPIDQPPKV